MRNRNLTPHANMKETKETKSKATPKTTPKATKDTAIRVFGTVLESLPGNLFHVQLDENDYKIVAYLAGKLMRHKIWVLPGDQVTVELSPYDLTRGRIVWRNPGQ